MQLYIDTTINNSLEVKVINKKKEIFEKNVASNYNQADLLLPTIEQVLKDAKIDLGELKKIIVNNSGGSFTSLRIGVVTANALAYALRIPVKQTKGHAKKINGLYMANPLYDKDPNIG